MNIERVLLQNPDFRLLRPDELSAFADAMTERHVRQGTEFIQEGKVDSDLYVVLSGQVAVTQRPSTWGQDVRIGEVGPGSLLGLVSLVDPGPRSSTCTAQTDVVLGVLPKSAFTLLYAASSGFSLRFRYIVARQIAGDLHRLGENLRRSRAGAV